MCTALLFAVHSSKEAFVTRLFIFVRERENTIYKNVIFSWCYIKILSHFTCKYITNVFAHNLYRLGPLIPLTFYAFLGKSISRLSHLDGTETDLNVSVYVIFSTLIRIFVSSGIAEGKLRKNPAFNNKGCTLLTDNCPNSHCHLTSLAMQ